MDKDILELLIQRRPPRIYKPGELIFCQGDEATEIFYLQSGLSLTYTILEDGRERNIMITWPGRFFGASTFFEKVPRRASAIALKESSVIVVDRRLYQECETTLPGFQALMISELSKDVGVLFEQLTDSSLLSADVNVARFICRRLKSGQFSARDGSPVLKYTQDFIASVLGLSVWSVNQALSDFREKGWIRTGHGRIVVLDPESLREYGYGSEDK